MRRKLLRNLDKLLGRPLAWLLVTRDRLLAARDRTGRPRRESAPGKAGEGPLQILVIKLVGLGDTVLMLTPLAELRRRFPRATITALVTPLSSGILEGQHSVDQVISVDALRWRRLLPELVGLLRLIRKRGFDCVIDFEQHFLLTAVLSRLTEAPTRIGFQFGDALRGKLYSDPVRLDPDCHMVDNFLKLLAPLGMDARPIDRLAGIDVPSSDEQAVASWLDARGIGPHDVIVALHAGSGPRATHRRWDKNKFAEIARRITSDLGARVILTGTAGERGLTAEIAALAGDGRTIDGAGQFEPRQLAALARRCSLFVSNDTGAMHIAAAAGTPTIGLFGPETPRRYGPVGGVNAAIYKPIDCSPCVAVHRGRARSCSDPRCIDLITVDDVWKAILRHGIGAPR